MGGELENLFCSANFSASSISDLKSSTILFSFIGAGASRFIRFVSRFKSRTALNKMDNILSQIPRNIRALTSIILSTMCIYLAEYPNENITPVLIESESSYNFFIQNSKIIPITRNTINLIDLINNLINNNIDLEKGMPNKNNVFTYNVYQHKYHYIVLFFALKEAFSRKTNTIYKQILDFCVNHIYLLCHIFDIIRKKYEEDKIEDKNLIIDIGTIIEKEIKYWTLDTITEMERKNFQLASSKFAVKEPHLFIKEVPWFKTWYKENKDKYVVDI
jgi:hypothetical protein